MNTAPDGLPPVEALPIVPRHARGALVSLAGTPRRAWIFTGACVLLAVVLFGLLSGDLALLDSLGTVFMYVVLVQAWNVLGGYGGYMNFGMAALFGVGAYTTAILSQHHGPSPLLAVPAAGLVTAAAGLLIAIPTLRLRGAYFAIVTLIITFAVELVALNASFTQGSMGIYLDPLTLSPRQIEQLFYFVFLALALVATATVYRIEHSNLGWALVAIREDEDAAEILGVRTTWAKVVAFLLGALMAGIIGGIYAYRVLYIEPTSTFTLDISLNAVLMAVLGGAGAWVGPLIGAPIVLLIADALRVTIAGEVNRIVFGLVLIVIALFVPDGIVGVIRRVGGRRFTV